MTLGNWGQSFLGDVAGGFFGNDYLRDYTHASKTFRPNSYENAPKLKFLFHVYFDFNEPAFSSVPNFGILVKEIKLPSYTIQTEQLNQYNRKRIIQTKIKYDPIDIVFHDDNGNNANIMWDAYYRYYYSDGGNPGQVLRGNRGNNRFFRETGRTITDYNTSNIYREGDPGDFDWGLSGGFTNNENKTKIPFFKNITVFGLNQHNFTAYTLINPVITNFSHDTYNYGEGSGIMQNRMTIDYETVVYNEGALDGRSPEDIVTGFGSEQNYDRRTSPIMAPGANGNILGQGGLVDGAGGAIRSLQEGDVLGAIQTAGRTYNSARNNNLVETAGLQLANTVRNALSNTPNTRNTLFSIPGSSQTPASLNTAGSPTVGARSEPQTIAGEPTVGDQVTGDSNSDGGFPVDAPFGANSNNGSDDTA